MDHFLNCKIYARAILVSILLMTAPVFAQQSGQPDNPYPLYDNMGNYSRTITTDSDLAQAYFDQGLRLAYSFARADAAESFRAAQHHDPECAMCYWGEAWVLGPYQNNPAGVGEYSDAVNASRKALELAVEAEPWEQAFIEAMVTRYPDPGNGEAATEAYADAMKTVAETYAGDLEAGTLYAESLMMYRPWNLHQENGLVAK